MDLSGMDEGKNPKVQTANIVNYLACVIHKLTGGKPWIAFDTEEILRYAGEQGIQGIEVELKTDEQGKEEVYLTYLVEGPRKPPQRRGFTAIEGGRND